MNNETNTTTTTTTTNTAANTWATILPVAKWLGHFPYSSVEWLSAYLKFLVDHIYAVAGQILVRASPLIAPAISAIAIFHALYLAYGFWTAIIGTAVIEGLGFSAVHVRDQANEHNAQNKENQVDAEQATSTVAAYFWVTILLILIFETIPSWVGLWTGKIVNGAPIDLSYCLAHTAPLAFPILANLGARIFSMMATIDRAKTTVKNHFEKIISDLQSALDKVSAELAQAKAALAPLAAVESDLRALRDAHARLLDANSASEAELHRLAATVEKLTQENVSLKIENARLGATLSAGQKPAESTLDPEINHVLTLWSQDGHMSLRDVGEKVGRSADWVRTHQKKLVDLGFISVAPNGKGNVVTVLKK